MTLTEWVLDVLGGHALVVLELLGTAAFAFSGVLGAMRKQMDMVGIVVCGFLAAFGGGTLRDVLIDRRPFFWVEHQSVLVAVLLLCVVCASFFKQQHLERGQTLWQIPDAVGLGLFCATGVHLSVSAGQPPLVAMMMGVITDGQARTGIRISARQESTRGTRVAEGASTVWC